MSRPPPLGREWIQRLIECNGLFSSVSTIDTNELQNFDKNAFVRELYLKYKNVIRQDLSPITGLGATLMLKPDVKPVFLKARSVRFRLIPLGDDALNMLEKECVLKRINSSLYATPIVPVLKKNDTIRICGDYSVTVNLELIINE